MLRFLFIILVLMATLIWWYSPGNKEDFSITFLDVGQGDSILFRFPGGETLLIDGGPGIDADWLLQDYVSRYFCHINVLLLTHPDADHISGLVRLLDHCTTNLVLHNPSSKDSNIYDRWLVNVTKFHGEEIYEGGKFSMSGVDFYVIWPPENLEDENHNNHSISLLVDYGEFEGLLLGDLENVWHTSILSNLRDLDQVIDRPIELMKAAHHGARNGLEEELVSWVDPEVFVISVGRDNSYGHPAPEVLEFLEGLGSRIYRTDRDGTVEISVR